VFGIAVFRWVLSLAALRFHTVASKVSELLVCEQTFGRVIFQYGSKSYLSPGL